MRVVECDGYTARCEAKGIERVVSLFLLQHEDVGPGDLVMVHVGYAIQTMSEAEAASAWQIYDEILDAEEKAFPNARTGDLPESAARGRARRAAA